MATFYKMDLCPEQTGYTVASPYAITRMNTEGGGSRYRVGKKNQPSTVTVQWITDDIGYNYLKAFYEAWQSQRPRINPFLLDLIIDYSGLDEYQCWFVGGLQLTAVSGMAYYVSATLEATARKRDSGMDEVILLGVLNYTNILESLVNKALPDATENLA
jgi:hypothetical protein